MVDIKKIKEEYEKLTQEFTDPKLISDWEKFKDVTKKRSALEKAFKKAEELEEVKEKIAENQQILSSPEDPELTSLAQQEFTALKEKRSVFSYNVQFYWSYGDLEKELRKMKREKKPRPMLLYLVKEDEAR